MEGKCSQWGWRLFQVNGCGTSSSSSSSSFLPSRTPECFFHSQSEEDLLVIRFLRPVTFISQVTQRRTDAHVKKLHCDSQPFSFPGKGQTGPMEKTPHSRGKKPTGDDTLAYV